MAHEGAGGVELDKDDTVVQFTYHGIQLIFCLGGPIYTASLIWDVYRMYAEDEEEKEKPAE